MPSFTPFLIMIGYHKVLDFTPKKGSISFMSKPPPPFAETPAW